MLSFSSQCEVIYIFFGSLGTIAMAGALQKRVCNHVVSSMSTFPEDATEKIAELKLQTPKSKRKRAACDHMGQASDEELSPFALPAPKTSRNGKQSAEELGLQQQQQEQVHQNPEPAVASMSQVPQPGPQAPAKALDDMPPMHRVCRELLGYLDLSQTKHVMDCYNAVMDMVPQWRDLCETEKQGAQTLAELQATLGDPAAAKAMRRKMVETLPRKRRQLRMELKSHLLDCIFKAGVPEWLMRSLFTHMFVLKKTFQIEWVQSKLFSPHATAHSSAPSATSHASSLGTDMGAVGTGRPEALEQASGATHGENSSNSVPTCSGRGTLGNSCPQCEAREALQQDLQHAGLKIFYI